MSTQNNNDKYQENMRTNPREICAIVHKDQTLAVQNSLSRAGIDNDSNQPLKVYSRYSRFPICIIQDRTSVTANLDIKSLPIIFEKTSFFQQEEIHRKLHDSVSYETDDTRQELSTAYTQILSSGVGMKGKTPAQFLIENAADNPDKAISALRKQYKWLRDSIEINSLSKFANSNKAQMAAIVDAVNLYKSGNLDANLSAPKPTESFFIYQSGFRPLINRPKKNEKTFIYEYNISWSFSERYPVTIAIKNYYAPVYQLNSGTLNVKAKDASNKKLFTMRLSAEEWSYIIYMIRTNMRLFENEYGSVAMQTANEQYQHNLAEAKKEPLKTA